MSSGLYHLFAVFLKSKISLNRQNKIQSEGVLDLSFYHCQEHSFASDHLLFGRGSLHILGLSCQGFLHLKKGMWLCLHMRPFSWKLSQKICFIKRIFSKAANRKHFKSVAITKAAEGQCKAA